MSKQCFRKLNSERTILTDNHLESIYFGGGTPSLLSQSDLEKIFEKIFKHFSVDQNAEVTLEANPDDLNPEKLQILQNLPVNRLSIGVQSFFDEDLKFWNRAHNKSEAEACIKAAQDFGFNNLTVDLIYGSPTTPHENWLYNIRQLLKFKVTHLSCYALTIEEKTALAHFVKSGKAKQPDDDHAATQFEMLMEQMNKYGYDHYEISNFAKPGFYAVHNSSYWKGKNYLGVGPAAHSFDGSSRQWNIPNNAFYIRAIEAISNGMEPPKPLFEKEVLSLAQRFNEYVMTGMRTIWGCSEKKIDSFGDSLKTHFIEKIQLYLQSGHMIQKQGSFVLTSKGKLLADQIASEIFYLEEE